MKANYGYADASGEYYITIDTDRCDGCGSCVKACPKNIFEIIPDDYDELKASVRQEFAKKVSYICPGIARCGKGEANCHTVCRMDAIQHSW